MRLLAISVLLVSEFVSPLFAANHYVLAAASGSGSGADWTNACTAFSGSCATLTRGDTYYVGTGTYTGPTFSTAISSTTLITIKGATAADHGVATGWNNSFGVDVTPATFTAGIEFSTANWVFDGIVGGGPVLFYPTTGYGFAITQTGANPLVQVDNGANNVTTRHLSLIGNSNSSGGGSIAQDAFAIKGGTNFTASYFYTNAIGRCPFFCGGVANACPGMIAEYGRIGTYVSTPSAHSEVMSTAGMSGDVDIRYNLITHIEGTGGFMWDNSGNHNAQFRLYGNTFYRATSDNSWDNCCNGLIGGFTGGGGEDFFNVRAYNNTFIQIPTTNGQIFASFPIRFGNNIAENNLFYNTVATNDYSDWTHDFNYYISSGGSFSEANAQTTPTTNPFTNFTAFDFSLLADTNAGTTLVSPFTLDPLGTTRGVNGVWDRGAFQVSGSSPTISPAPAIGMIASK